MFNIRTDELIKINETINSYGQTKSIGIGYHRKLEINNYQLNYENRENFTSDE